MWFVSMLRPLVLQTDLLPFADVVVGTFNGPGLSGGQKRRLAVALQLLKLPSVIFLDEPTSGMWCGGVCVCVCVCVHVCACACVCVHACVAISFHFFSPFSDISNLHYTRAQGAGWGRGVIYCIVYSSDEAYIVWLLSGVYDIILLEHYLLPPLPLTSFPFLSPPLLHSSPPPPPSPPSPRFPSGLDATSSQELLTTLNRLAGSNRTVVLTIHQPRLEIFHMFHRLVVLSDGQVCKGVLEYARVYCNMQWCADPGFREGAGSNNYIHKWG